MKEMMLLDGRTLLVRKVDVEDAQDMLIYLHQIARESEYLTFGEGELSTTLEEEIQYLEGLSCRNNVLMLAAFLDGELVGNIHFSGGTRVRTRHAGEFGISVLKKHWGMGIGAVLIKEMLEWASAGGIIKKINLQVRTDNEYAISLYEKHGFITEGTVTKALKVGDVYYNNYMMGREIR